MKLKRIVILTVCVFLLSACVSACGNRVDDLAPMMQLRQDLAKADGCSFLAEITADYGDRIYNFTLKCTTNATGDAYFEVMKPESIAGISGRVSPIGGKLEFDDQVLLFSGLTQGQITPVIAPWLMIKAITGGYISAVNNDMVVTINDTFSGDELLTLLTLQENARPSYCELFYKNRRILSLHISDFCIL